VEGFVILSRRVDFYQIGWAFESATYSYAQDNDTEKDQDKTGDVNKDEESPPQDDKQPPRDSAKSFFRDEKKFVSIFQEYLSGDEEIDFTQACGDGENSIYTKDQVHQVSAKNKNTSNKRTSNISEERSVPNDPLSRQSKEKEDNFCQKQCIQPNDKAVADSKCRFTKSYASNGIETSSPKSSMRGFRGTFNHPSSPNTLSPECSSARKPSFIKQQIAVLKDFNIQLQTLSQRSKITRKF
jgi:hypothetical protein